MACCFVRIFDETWGCRDFCQTSAMPTACCELGHAVKSRASHFASPTVCSPSRILASGPPSPRCARQRPRPRFEAQSSALSPQIATVRRIVGMATLLDADLPSDDDADEDFNPTGVQFRGASKSARPKRGLMELSDDEDAPQPSSADGMHRMLADGLADAMDEACYAQPPPGASSEDEEGGSATEVRVDGVEG